jgi:hypothetical protein
MLEILQETESPQDVDYERVVQKTIEFSEYSGVWKQPEDQPRKKKVLFVGVSNSDDDDTSQTYDLSEEFEELAKRYPFILSKRYPFILYPIHFLFKVSGLESWI